MLSLPTDALFLYLAMQEFEFDGKLLKGITIGEEISSAALGKYIEHLCRYVYPPPENDTIKELAGDGNEKVLQKCSQGCAPKKRGGRQKRINMA